MRLNLLGRHLLAAVACAAVLLPGPAAGAASTGAASMATTGPAKSSPWSVQRIPATGPATPNGVFLAVSCPTAAWCMAVGWYNRTDGTRSPLAETWDGTAWRLASPPNPAGAIDSQLTAVSCVSPSSCQAVGGTMQSEGTFSKPAARSALVEHWNGTSWRREPIRLPFRSEEATSVSRATATMCVVVGEHVTLGHRSFPFSARWDGQRWTALPVPRPDLVTDLNGVSCPGPDSCYAVGERGASVAIPVHPLTMHWDGSRWHLLAVPGAPREAIFSAVSCPTLTACTVVGQAGGDASFSRMLVEDLSQGRWTTSRPPVPAAAAAGSTTFTAVSCSEPRVCTALVSYLHPAPAGGEAWATASRDASGGFRVTIPAGNVSAGEVSGVSCQPAACTVAGVQGTLASGGQTLALRGKDGRFTRQRTKNLPLGAGGQLVSVSCAGHGFCAATTAGGDPRGLDPGEHPVLVRRTAAGPWSVPPDGTPGVLTAVSCTSPVFCLALGSAAGAQRWDGHRWSPAPAPGHPEPGRSGLQQLSCTSPSFCLAVGFTAGLSGRAEYSTWNGRAWTPLAAAPSPPGTSQSELDSVSCASARFCVAAGTVVTAGTLKVRALVEMRNGTAWTIASPHMLASFSPAVSVSCAAATACMAVWGGTGHARAQWWDGTAWTGAAFAPAAPGFTRSIVAVSCPSAVSCTAAGSIDRHNLSRPLIQDWDGHRWRVTPAAPPAEGGATLTAVSCTAPGACTAVGQASLFRILPFAEARG
jgi:hypothetical protein